MISQLISLAHFTPPIQDAGVPCTDVGTALAQSCISGRWYLYWFLFSGEPSPSLISKWQLLGRIPGSAGFTVSRLCLMENLRTYGSNPFSVRAAYIELQRKEIKWMEFQTTSEVEHTTSLSWRLPTIFHLYEWAGKTIFVSLKLKGQSGVRNRYLVLSKQAALITAPGPSPARSRAKLLLVKYIMIFFFRPR